MKSLITFLMTAAATSIAVATVPKPSVCDPKTTTKLTCAAVLPVAPGVPTSLVVCEDAKKVESVKIDLSGAPSISAEVKVGPGDNPGDKILTLANRQDDMIVALTTEKTKKLAYVFAKPQGENDEALWGVLICP